MLLISHRLKPSTGELSRQVEEKDAALSQIHRVKNTASQQTEELKRHLDEETKVRRCTKGHTKQTLR
jgi:hypothetical protein